MEGAGRLQRPADHCPVTGHGEALPGVRGGLGLCGSAGGAEIPLGGVVVGAFAADRGRVCGAERPVAVVVVLVAAVAGSVAVGAVRVGWHGPTVAGGAGGRGEVGGSGPGDRAGWRAASCTGPGPPGRLFARGF